MLCLPRLLNLKTDPRVISLIANQNKYLPSGFFPSFIEHILENLPIMPFDSFDESKIPLNSSIDDDLSSLDLENAIEQTRTSPRFLGVYFLLNATILAFSIICFGLSLRQNSSIAYSNTNAIKDTSYYCKCSQTSVV